jgi:hypothetical protein
MKWVFRVVGGLAGLLALAAVALLAMGQRAEAGKCVGRHRSFARAYLALAD